MNARSNWPFLITFGLAATYACFFPVLAVDTSLKAVQWAPILETSTFLLVLFFEISKIVTSMAGLIAAAWLVLRGRRAGARALALALLFGAVAFGKVMNGGAFPGTLQEWLARELLGAGVPSGLLAWLFGPSAWAVWPAAAALLRFSAVFPHQLTPDIIDASGRRDRRGLLRGSGVAGLDMGAVMRSLSKRVIARGGYSPGKLTALAVTMIAVHTVLSQTPAGPLIWIAAALGAGVVITNARAGYTASGHSDQAALAWITTGFVLAVFTFLSSSAVAVLFATNAARVAGLAFISLTPAIIMGGFAVAVLSRPRQDARTMIDQVIRAGSIAFALAVVSGLTYMLISQATRGMADSARISALGAAAVVILGYNRLRRLVDRIRLAVLEHAHASATLPR